MSTVADYQGRTVDVSAYQGMKAKGEVKLLSVLAEDGTGGRICTGIQKLVQRFIIELFTEKGSIPYMEQRGTGFMTEARLGYLRTQIDIFAAFSRALSDLKVSLSVAESSDDPADERFFHAEIISIEYAAGNAKIFTRIYSLDSAAKAILPISVSI